MKTHLLLRILAFLWSFNLTVSHTNSDHIKMISSRHDLGLKDVPRVNGVLSDDPCPTKYTKVGCYNDKRKASKRAMRDLLFQDRKKGKSFSGQKIDWEHWETYLPDLVCRCAEAAANRGFVFFGIQFYGECWSSADAAQRFFKYQSNDKCVNTEYEACDIASDKACAGVAHMNYVYQIASRFPEGSGVEPPINPEEY